MTDFTPELQTSTDLQTSADDTTETASAFAELGLSPALVSTLTRNGITTPSPVQLQAIPVLLAGKDLIASAPTGTGKTAAFLLPALMRLAQEPINRSKGPRVLVLTPTRELAQQVSKAAHTFSRGVPRCKTVCVTGGESYRTQNMLISSPHEILVATPGRLMDQISSGRLDFSRLEVLVLDEADRMLDMGFAEDVMSIAEALPAERQTVCFTATLSRSVRDMADQLLTNPEWLEVAQLANRHDAIDQQVIFVDNESHKRDLLRHWLADHQLEQAIIFTATKRAADELAEALDSEDTPTVALHGDLVQRQRTRTLNQLRRGEFRVLVATDVAARGIDVASITHVFNYDLPRFAEDYVHRIGRTGRAGATGTAVSFVGRDDVFALRRIERFISQKIAVSSVAGLEARFNPAERPAGGGAGKRKPFGNSSKNGEWRGRSGGPGRGPRQDGGGFGGNRDSQPRGERSFAPRDGQPPREGGFARDGQRDERRSWNSGAPRDNRGWDNRGRDGGQRDWAPREPRDDWQSAPRDRQPRGEWGNAPAAARPARDQQPRQDWGGRKRFEGGQRSGFDGAHRHEGHGRPGSRHN